MDLRAIFSGVALLVLGAAPAGADDLSAWDWSQFYVGAGGGVNLTSAQPGETVSATLNGADVDPFVYVPSASAYLLAGYVHELGPVVVGVEGEFDLGGPVTLDTAPYDSCDSTTTTNCVHIGGTGTIDTLGRIRALVGLPLSPQVLVFMTAGVAVADIHSTSLEAVAASPGTGNVFIDSWDIRRRAYGLTIGLGTQVKITNNISLRGEVIHDTYAIPTPLQIGSAGNPAAGFDFNVDRMTFGTTAVRASLIAGF